MNLHPYRKTKIFLVFNFIVLLFLILTIPQFIDTGTSWASEDTLETLFIGMSFLAVVYVFWHYDYVVKKREQQTSQLSQKLEKKEKELLDTFQYLGKVNVQFSIIRDLLEKMKIPAPTTRKEVEKVFTELLSIVCNATGRSHALLKIVNLENQRTLIKQFNGFSKEKGYKIKNESLIKFYKNKSEEKNLLNGWELFCSELDNFYIKAFLILPKKDEPGMEDEKDFLEAVANQCEILFLLFNSRYYKPKKEKNGSKK
ncbi:MAG: hypothetical protein U5L10_05370 [Candidatus Moranbacteria bacterium]|nr:hypothetical protein [Candidatus Moranbacteria bacterium]